MFWLLHTSPYFVVPAEPVLRQRGEDGGSVDLPGLEREVGELPHGPGAAAVLEALVQRLQEGQPAPRSGLREGGG
jgi:hypothetical protein